MSESFIFKGIASSELGVVMNEKWIDCLPAMAYEEIDVEGRDGAILTPLNYKLVSKEVSCTLLNKDRLNEVLAWLHGSGTLELNGKYRNAAIFDGIEFTKHGMQRLDFRIPFLMEPFWYKDDAFQTVTTSVTNEGNIDAVPLIKVSGSGTASLTVNEIVIGLDFSVASSIVIDCLEKTEDFPKAVSIGFSYPTLKPGDNTIQTSGTITVQMKRKDRWIG